jgi:hypothetical protein
MSKGLRQYALASRPLSVRQRVAATAIGLVLVAGGLAASAPSDPSMTGSPRDTAAARHGGHGAVLRPVDGGPNYYGRFAHSLPSSPSFFPIGVWFESVTDPSDAQMDKLAGINTYVVLTLDSNLDIVRRAGMFAVPYVSGGNGSETVGWFLGDEVDMAGGPGSGGTSGDGCSQPDSPCGYTMMQQAVDRFPSDDRMRYANYGKGITFWETRSQAAAFVNRYQDVLSADNYWFTDDNICGPSEGATFFPSSDLVDGSLPPSLCHRAANYGLTVSKVRSLESPAGSKPVWAFVEVGHSASEASGLSIKPWEIVAAVWSSIIHGARGIVYFNHSFGGPCQTQHALREDCYAAQRAAVTRVNSQISALAPVLNAPFANGVVRSAPGVDTSTKWYDGHFYVLAGSTFSASHTAKFAVSCTGNATVTVLNENRRLRVANGSFSDTFADGNTVHIYRIDGGSSCGAY